MTVVVGFMPTPEGRAALRRAVHEADRRSCRLLVLQSPSRHLQAPSADLEEDLQTAAEQGVEVELRAGGNQLDPAEDLMVLAEEEQATLIVIGLRRRTPVGKLILGSQAQRILLEATCPVLAVKSDSIL